MIGPAGWAFNGGTDRHTCVNTCLQTHAHTKGRCSLVYSKLATVYCLRDPILTIVVRVRYERGADRRDVLDHVEIECDLDEHEIALRVLVRDVLQEAHPIVVVHESDRDTWRRL